MNLIQRLFGGRPKTAPVSTVPCHVWVGQSGREYPYSVYPIDTPFKPGPANYILAAESQDGDWIPLFIAQTRDLHQRLEGSEQQGHARQQGATHIHVHIGSGNQAARCTEDHDLILRWRPACNDLPEG